MIRPHVIILILLWFTSCKQKSNSLKVSKKTITQNTKPFKDIDGIEPDHDTLPNGIRMLDNIDSSMKLYYKEVVGPDTLQGGFIACYGIDDSTKYYYLRKGETLYLLNKTPIYTSTWSLGQLERDFPTFFLTRVDNGNGCPSSYQLFNKKDGSNLLAHYSYADSYTYFKDTLFLLCNNWAKNQKYDSIILLNSISKRQESFKLPNDMPEFCGIQINQLTSKKLRISLSSYGGGEYIEKSISYSR